MYSELLRVTWVKAFNPCFDDRVFFASWEIYGTGPLALFCPATPHLHGLKYLGSNVPDTGTQP